MKQFRKFKVIILLFLFLQLGLSVTVRAGADPYCDPDCNCINNDPNQVCPIDGGVVALIVLGAAYGIKKVVDNRKTEANAF